jgi:hypothetical protein
MEKYHLPEDITAMYITAGSFPDGVLAAHQKLHGTVQRTNERKYYGISFRDKSGTIIYKAAAEELREGEAESLGLATYVIRKGDYISIDIHDFMHKVTSIGETFQKLISDPRIDPNGACIEWYMNDDDMKCMVRLSDQV